MSINLAETDLALVDWSGTFSNDARLVYEANQQLLEGYGYPRLSFDEWRDGREGWNASIYLEKQGRGDLGSLYKEYEGCWQVTAQVLPAPTAYKGARDFFIACNETGLPVEIISSHPPVVAEVALYGLGKLIKSDRIHSLVSNKPAAMSASLEQNGVKPERAVYLGDTVQDMRAAHKVGVGSIAITHGYHTERLLRDEQPDMVVASLPELTEEIYRSRG